MVTAGIANANTDGLSGELWFPAKGEGMSEIKENIKTSLTGIAAHLQQLLKNRVVGELVTGTWLEGYR